MSKPTWKTFAISPVLSLGLSLGLALGVGLAVSGCGDDTTTSPDLSASGTTCGVIATCILQASGNVTAIQGCIAKGSSTAMMKYNSLQTCAITACTTGTDAGAAKCTSATDTSSGCVTCATAAAQSAGCMTQLTACTTDK
jgi:hypothetical protein